MIDRRRLMVAASALCAGAATAARAEAPDARREDALGAAFEGSGAPALAGAVIGPEGLIWTGVRGVRRLGREEAASTGDRWHLGSNTKAMTAMLYARQVEQGRADWDAVLPELFPDLPVHEAWADVTLSDLMSHRAGLLDAQVLDLPTRLGGLQDRRPLDRQRTDLTRRALAQGPAGERGVFAYGNLNYIVAGAAIERITGGAWEEAIRGELFAPLGITSAGFGAPEGDQPRGHMDVFGRATAVEAHQPGADNPPFLGPAGTAHMTLEDYGRFLALFLTDGGGIVTPETVWRLTTPAAGADYALGWIVRNHSPLTGGRMLGHEGSNTLWHMTTLVAPDGGFAVVAASNDHARGGPATQTLAAALARIGA